MHSSDLSAWRHDHLFLGTSHRRNERKAWIVIRLTAAMMVVELIAGSIYGSMALIAEGLHMLTHVGALGITALAYLYARQHAGNPAFTFGTGKFGDLAGFTSAIVLGIISLLIAYESITRLFEPVNISFDQAIVVAVLGLAVNLVSAYVLHDRQAPHEHAREHGHYGDTHSHGETHGRARPAHEHRSSGHVHRHRHHHRDHNLRSAHLHVLADGLTALLAVVALAAGRAYGWVWMDPLMGIVGSLVIARWSYGLIRDTTLVLLDAQASPQLADEIRRAVEAGTDDRVVDLHVWRVGPGHFAAIVSIVSDQPRPTSEIKAVLAHWKELCHVTVEVNACSGPHR